MMMKLITYSNTEQLEIELVEKITVHIRKAIEIHGFATLLVSGGSTPVKLYQKLSMVELNWNKVNIALVDERFVSPESDFSNEKAVRKYLIQHLAKQAKFTGMVKNTVNRDENLILAKENYRIFINSPATVSILGMGEDGHTASLFPGDASSENDLSGESEADLILTKAPAYPEERISCNKKLLLNSEHIYLMICGKSKLNVLSHSKEHKLPVSYFIDEQRTTIHYSEKT